MNTPGKSSQGAPAKPRLPEQAVAESARAKYANLLSIIREMGSVLVAFSGGADSTLLLAASAEALGKHNVLAVTARSVTYSAGEFEEAQRLAAMLGVRHVSFESNELEIPKFRENPVDRCYYCKVELLRRMRAIAEHEGIKFVVEGSNYDDLDDYRPGRRALREFWVRSPLCEARLRKPEVRLLLRDKGLPNWDRPSMACLASRIPYGIRIDPDILRRVDRAERFVRSFGVRQVRVRHHGDTARIEVSKEDLPLLVAPGVPDELVAELADLGYTYVTLDLAGYRSGSLNLPVLAGGDARERKAAERAREERERRAGAGDVEDARGAGEQRERVRSGGRRRRRSGRTGRRAGAEAAVEETAARGSVADAVSGAGGGAQETTEPAAARQGQRRRSGRFHRGRRGRRRSSGSSPARTETAQEGGGAVGTPDGGHDGPAPEGE